MEMNCIAIDGPAGAGKSTIAKVLSSKLGMPYLETGAMYRSIAYYVIQNKIDIDNNKSALIEKLSDIDIKVKYANNIQLIFLDNKDVTKHLRNNDVSKMSSKVATIKEVRKKLVDLQKEIAKEYNIIMDGRDICTNVLPNAKYKFFITADIEIRAKRRQSQLVRSGKQISLKEMIEEIKSRDHNDATREHAPLIQSPDAIVVNTTNITVQQAIDFMIDNIDKVDSK